MIFNMSRETSREADFCEANRRLDLFAHFLIYYICYMVVTGGAPSDGQIHHSKAVARRPHSGIPSYSSPGKQHDIRTVQELLGNEDV